MLHLRITLTFFQFVWIKYSKFYIQKYCFYAIYMLYYFTSLITWNNIYENVSIRPLGSILKPCKSTISGSHVLSSPAMKAQVSFSDRLSSIACPSVHLSVNFSYFWLFLKNHRPILTKLGTQCILGSRGFKFVQMKGHSLSQGEIITK